MNKQRIDLLTKKQKETLIIGLNKESPRRNIIWTLDWFFDKFFEDEDVRGFVQAHDIFVYNPLCVANIIAFSNILKKLKWYRYHYCLYDPDSDRALKANLFDETGRYFDLYRDVYNIPYMLVEKMRSNGLNKDNNYWISISAFKAEMWGAINDYISELQKSLEKENQDDTNEGTEKENP